MTLIKARKIATVGRLFSPCALASYQWPVILFRRKIRPKVWAQYHPETSPTALLSSPAERAGQGASASRMLAIFDLCQLLVRPCIYPGTQKTGAF